MSEKTELSPNKIPNLYKSGIWWAILIASLLLAAHLSRHEQDVVAIVTLIFPLFLGLDKKWLWQLQTIILGIGTILWIYATYNLFNQRLEAGLPYLRLLSILSLIIIYNAVVFYRTYKFLINRKEKGKK